VFYLVLPLYKSFAKNYRRLPACAIPLLKQDVKPPENRSSIQGFCIHYAKAYSSVKPRSIRYSCVQKKLEFPAAFLTSLSGASRW